MNLLGDRPVRKALGRMPAAEARRCARLLSTRFDLYCMKVERGLEKGSSEDLEAELEQFAERLKDKTWIERSYEAIETLRTEAERQEDENASLRNAVTTLATKQAPPPPPLPLFSILAGGLIEQKQTAMPRSNYPNKLRVTARAWILVFGDRPVDAYNPSFIQDFANALAELPRNWAVTPRYRDMTYDEIVAVTKAKREAALQGGGKPPDRFSKTTIGEYVTQARHIWRHIRSKHHREIGDYSSAPLTIPRVGRRKKVRNPIDGESVNKWLRHAVHQKRPDDRFLPLLGMLTGARLGELTFLKGEDVRMYEGHLCISLLDEEGVEAREEGRPLKTDESRRIIVLHDIIMRTGFPDWVAERRPDDWIWPRLHQRAAGAAIVRPAGAASKRQIRSMQAAGVHQPYTDVFHSLRHGAKDWHRDATVADRTSRLQIGHSFRDVDDSYGSKRLRQKEIDDLASLALPEGVDFAPYLIREEPLKDLPRKQWR